MKPFIFLILFLGIFIFYLPELASTKFSNEILNNILFKKTGIRFESAKFSWQGSQIFSGINYSAKNKKILINQLTFQNKEFQAQEILMWIGDHHLKGDQIALALGSDASIPLFFSLQKIHAPHMTLKLGKMIWQNFGAVKDLLSILQLKIRFDADIPLWFQDSPASLTNGRLQFERTEFLLDNAYEFAFWDTIDLTKEEYHLKIGIPQNTLQKVLNLTTLPAGYTITLKLTGPLSDPTLQTSSALKTIAKLLLLNQLPLSPVPSSKPCPPARPPFPWN
jgi:hypothetical protein